MLPETGRAAGQAPDRFSEFADEMRLLVAEQAALWEFPLGSVCVIGGTRIRHGPWPQAECADALRIWLDAGLVTLCRFRTDGSEPDLSPAEAREALEDPAAWQPPAGSGFVSAYQSIGKSESWASWTARLEPLRARLA
jgi:hypothetical protein